MLNDFTWNMTGYIPKHQVNPHGDGIIPYVAERIFQLEPEPPAVGNLNEYILSALHEKDCFIELESHRVGQKADRNDHTGNDCQNNNPERRFLIIHHRLHTIFNTNFTKGKWAGRNHATVDAADHKSLCIVGSLFVAKFLDDLFITGKLNVTAKKYISQPHQRIEPMNRQQEKTKRLPPMVFAANVRLFVGNNVLQILTIHVEREIDSRFDNAQDKRRTYILTLENVALVANSGIHFTT